MQAFSITFPTPSYDGDMQTGRPPKHPRSEFGERLHALREAKGFSQAYVAEKLDITQPSYALWERYPTALKPEQIKRLAAILDVSYDELFGKPIAKIKGGGPTGKAHRLFEEVSRLSRHQQQRITGIIEDFLAARRYEEKQAA